MDEKKDFIKNNVPSLRPPMKLINIRVLFKYKKILEELPLLTSPPISQLENWI